jgi:hypothetical protein
MSNVICVEFGKKNVAQEVPGTDTASSLTAYLNSLREKGVDEDDILDILDAINDMDIYFTADEVVQEFADGWLQQFL